MKLFCRKSTSRSEHVSLDVAVRDHRRTGEMGNMNVLLATIAKIPTVHRGHRPLRKKPARDGAFQPWGSLGPCASQYARTSRLTVAYERLADTGGWIRLVSN